MEDNIHLLKKIDKMMEISRFKLIRGLVSLADDIATKINTDEKSSADDFQQLTAYTNASETLLLNFLRLSEWSRRPIFEAYEKEITESLNTKTSQQLTSFKKAYNEIILKSEQLLNAIKSR